MSADPRTIQAKTMRLTPSFAGINEGVVVETPNPFDNMGADGGERKLTPDVKVRDTLPRETEKEKIKRQLYNLIDRVDKL